MRVPPDKTFPTARARIKAYEQIIRAFELCHTESVLDETFKEFDDEIRRLKLVQETEDTHGFDYYDEIKNHFEQRKTELGDENVYTTARTERI